MELRKRFGLADDLLSPGFNHSKDTGASIGIQVVVEKKENWQQTKVHVSDAMQQMEATTLNSSATQTSHEIWTKDVGTQECPLHVLHGVTIFSQTTTATDTTSSSQTEPSASSTNDFGVQTTSPISDEELFMRVAFEPWKQNHPGIVEHLFKTDPILLTLSRRLEQCENELFSLQLDVD